MEEVLVEGSCFGGGSNAMILPAKKNKKRKGMNQEREAPKKNQNLKLSNSQIRKLRKLEEDKERALLLSKSIETLEKYKIPEEALSLLQSSKDINRAETAKEKRRMAMQFSKAGLEVQQDDQSVKRSGGSAFNDSGSDLEDTSLIEDDNKNADMQPKIAKTGLPNDAYASGNVFDLNGGSVSDFSKDMSVKDSSTRVQEATISSRIMFNPDCQKSSNLMDKSSESLIVGCGKSSNLPIGSLQRPHTAPVVVHVSRPNEVEEIRKELPIVMMEQEIMEAINENSAVIICGETGCGKTTQVPQFLYEAGFGSEHSAIRRGIIGVTQPRRVAVFATAKRVAYELGFCLGREVGFQVRHDKRIGNNCSIKFMTDGILLREIQSDFLLRRYSVIILDEVHERTVNTDILIGMLSRTTRVRQIEYEKQQQMILLGQIVSPDNMIFPLKLVLMSATLRVEDFVSGDRLFRKHPPIVEVDTRRYEVKEYFSKKTETVDYIGKAYKKVLNIHKSLPLGGILVFVTGQREVEYLCQRLRKASKELMAKTAKGNTGNKVTAKSELDSIDGINMQDINEAFGTAQQQGDRFSSYDQDIHDFNEDEAVSFYDSEYESETESELEFDDGDSGDLKAPKNEGVLGKEGGLASLKAAFEALAGKTPSKFSSNSKEIHVTEETNPEQPKRLMEKGRSGDGGLPKALHVLPLYAMLPASAQLRVFEEVKEGERLVIVATNVAETSLTIPGIKYVVDTGREKVKNYNLSNGMAKYEVQWISKASATQRAGRAGRTGPGHCYRLYSQAVFSGFPNFSDTEISNVPIDSIVLLLKSMNIVEVKNFPFPTPPEASALLEAERCLKILGALNSSGGLTPLGKAMARYPMSPRHSCMLLTAIQLMRKMKNHAKANLVLAYAVAAAAALSLRNPFLILFEGSENTSNDSDWATRPGGQESEKILDKQKKLMKKKVRETAKAYHARFSNPTSDALTVAYALQCFEISKSSEFCNEYGLHLKTMEEMSKLRKQLLQLVFIQKADDGSEQDFAWNHGTVEDVEQSWRLSSSKNSLSLHGEEYLGQAICAGWADRVAMRVAATSWLSESKSKVNAARYQACMVKETVFLHRWSSLSNAAPNYLVYSELLETKRPYMLGATSVRPEWLVKYAEPSCSFSSVDEKPYYDPETDQVCSWFKPTFGPYQWELPRCSFPIRSGVDCVKAFAYALLEGQVLPCVKFYREFMAARPSIILGSEALGQKRVGCLISKLETRSIHSCTALRETWKVNPQELHSEILEWFQKSFHDNFEALWIQMQAEVKLDPKKRFSSNKQR